MTCRMEELQHMFQQHNYTAVHTTLQWATGATYLSTRPLSVTGQVRLSLNQHCQEPLTWPQADVM